MSRLKTDAIRNTSASADALTFDTNGNTKIADNEELQIGTGGDLVLKHDGSDSYISNVGTGELIIQAKTGETGAVIRTDGGVELFADNVKKVSTHTTFGTILSNSTDDAAENNVLTLARKGYEISGYGVNFKVKGGSSSGQNGLLMQVSQGSGGYSDKFRFDNDGLKFGSDTAAANGLDDYEEGTFTPGWVGQSGAGTTNYNNNTANYTKIGRVVHCNGYTNMSSSSGHSGDWILNNLPFASGNGYDFLSTGSCFIEHCEWSTNSNWLVTYKSDNDSTMKIYGSERNATWRALSTADDSSFGIIWDITYHAA